MSKMYECIEKWMNQFIFMVKVWCYRGKNTLQNEEGIGVVEVILILVVLIGLVIIFKSQLTDLVDSIFEKIVDESSGI